MPRRNVYLLVAAVVISLACYQRRDPAGRYSRTFGHALDEVAEHYIEPVDRRQLFEAAMSGMMSQLDPYSSFIAPSEYRELEESLEQQFGGIGIQVTIDRDTKRLTVMSPLFGTPAYEAGVLAGDQILAIDGESTDDFEMKDALLRLRGPPGESVTLTILHKGQTDPVSITLQRAIIRFDTVLGDSRKQDQSWDYLLEGPSGIGYVRITSFSEKTVDELRRALESLKSAGARALVIDLRNNPGGLLRSAVEVSDLFLERGRIVSTQGRAGDVLETYDATPGSILPHVPMVVLVNKYSASASEIVAAALQDHQRAIVVGERTWGKGSVQHIIPLEGGRSALKLTIASYWRPSGQNIHRGPNDDENQSWGVTPNEGFLVELTPEQAEEMARRRVERDIIRSQTVPPEQVAEPAAEPLDPQLLLGVEYLEAVLRGERPALVSSGGASRRAGGERDEMATGPEMTGEGSPSPPSAVAQ